MGDPDLRYIDSQSRLILLPFIRAAEALVQRPRSARLVLAVKEQLVTVSAGSASFIICLEDPLDLLQIPFLLFEPPSPTCRAVTFLSRVLHFRATCRITTASCNRPSTISPNDFGCGFHPGECQALFRLIVHLAAEYRASFWSALAFDSDSQGNGLSIW